jgi:uncharacterized protein YuzE
LTGEQGDKMRLKVDKNNDALYFRLDEASIIESEEVQPGVILDFNADGKVVGFEILNLSSRILPEKLKVLQFETV